MIAESETDGGTSLRSTSGSRCAYFWCALTVGMIPPKPDRGWVGGNPTLAPYSPEVDCTNSFVSGWILDDAGRTLSQTKGGSSSNSWIQKKGARKRGGSPFENTISQ